jgi:hypothetical protein
VVKLWREDLQKKGLARAAESLADPLEYDNLFPDISLVRIPPRPFIKLSPFSVAHAHHLNSSSSSSLGRNHRAQGLRAEEIAQEEREQAYPATRYLDVKENLDRDIVAGTPHPLFSLF